MNNERTGGGPTPPIGVDVPENAACCGSAQSDATISALPRGCSSMVERQPSKLNVAGSSPVTRFDAVSCIVSLGVALVGC